MNLKVHKGTAKSLLDSSLVGQPLWFRVGDDFLEVQVVTDHFGDVNAVVVKFYTQEDEKVLNEADPIEFATGF